MKDRREWRGLRAFYKRFMVKWRMRRGEESE
jgi:hypothetical protein